MTPLCSSVSLDQLLNKQPVCSRKHCQCQSPFHNPPRTAPGDQTFCCILLLAIVISQHIAGWDPALADSHVGACLFSRSRLTRSPIAPLTNTLWKEGHSLSSSAELPTKWPVPWSCKDLFQLDKEVPKGGNHTSQGATGLTAGQLSHSGVPTPFNGTTA